MPQILMPFRTAIESLSRLFMCNRSQPQRPCSLSRSNTGVVGWIPTRDMDVSVCLFCSCYACGWRPCDVLIPHQRAYQMCVLLRNSKSSQSPTEDCISFQFNSLLFMCLANSYKASYRHSTVKIYITT
jgi:hypothetical protein